MKVHGVGEDLEDVFLFHLDLGVEKLAAGLAQTADLIMIGGEEQSGHVSRRDLALEGVEKAEKFGEDVGRNLGRHLNDHWPLTGLDAQLDLRLQPLLLLVTTNPACKGIFNVLLKILRYRYVPWLSLNEKEMQSTYPLQGS